MILRGRFMRLGKEETFTSKKTGEEGHCISAVIDEDGFPRTVKAYGDKMDEFKEYLSDKKDQSVEMVVGCRGFAYEKDGKWRGGVEVRYVGSVESIYGKNKG